MEQSGRFELGTVLVGVSAALLFSAIRVALPSTRSSVAGHLTQRDLRRLYDEELIAVAGPAGASPDELVRTILQDPTIPSRIRAPFAALAKTKAPHLLAHAVTTD